MTVVTSNSRNEMNRRLLERMASRVADHGRGLFLYLASTRRKTREMAARLRGLRPSWRHDFLVPAELAEKLAGDSTSSSPQPVRPELKALLLGKILQDARELHSSWSLGFDRGLTPGGVVRQVGHTLDVLCRRSLSPLDKTAGIRPDLARDVSHVKDRYDDALKLHGLVDPVHVPLLATEALRSRQARLPESLELLILDGFVAPEKAEADFLIEVVRACEGKEVLVTVPANFINALRKDGWNNLPPHLRIFRHGKEFFERLGLTRLIRTSPKSGERGGKSIPEPAELVIPSEELSPTVASEMGFHVWSVPASEGCRSAAVRERSQRIVRKYPSRVEEVKGIAREIKSIFFDEDRTVELTPEDFHVVVPRIDPYYRLFIELYPRYGIPFNITRGIPLSSIPVVGLITALMDSVLVRDHAALYRLYSSRMVTVPLPETVDDSARFSEFHAEMVGPLWPVNGGELQPGSYQLEIAALDRVCREAGVPGGTDLAQDWLGPIARWFTARVLAARNADDPAREERLNADFRDILVQLWLVAREFQVLDELSQKKAPSEVVQKLELILDRYNVRKNLIQSLASLEISVPAGRRIVIEKNAKGFSRALELLREIAHDLQITGQRESDLETIRDLFVDRCRREMIQEAGELAGVSISEMLEIRNLARPVVFMAGLTADDFPTTPTGNFILPQGPDSESFARAVDESRYILHEVLVNSGTVVLSHPVSDNGEPLETSPLLEDLIHSGDLRVEEAKANQGEPLCSYEILQEIGRSWREDEPVPWDKIAWLAARFPAKSNHSIGAFHQDVRRALCASLQQCRTDRPGPYDGMIQSTAALEAINAMLDDPRFSYSVSMLNDYRRCPLAFFFRRILALEPVREILEEPDAAEIGSAVHEILARFYEERVTAALGRITPVNRIDALITLYETAGKILAQNYVLAGDELDVTSIRRRITNGLYPRDKLSDSGLRDRVLEGTDVPRHKRGLLRILVDHEADVDLPLFPWRFEMGFGYGDTPVLTVPGNGKRPIRIKGRIDRIDLYRENEQSRGLAVWVFDYKTGNYPSMTDVQKGNDLQLQVYLLAIRTVAERMGIREVGACFLSLRPNEAFPRRDVLYTKGGAPVAVAASKQNQWQISDRDFDGFRNHIKEIDAAIRRGEFPRTRNDSPCAACEYYLACFRDENRIRALARE